MTMLQAQMSLLPREDPRVVVEELVSSPRKEDLVQEQRGNAEQLRKIEELGNSLNMLGGENRTGDELREDIIKILALGKEVEEIAAVQQQRGEVVNEEEEEGDEEEEEEIESLTAEEQGDQQRALMELMMLLSGQKQAPKYSNDTIRQLEEQAMAAQDMLSQVQNLREEIVQVKSGDSGAQAEKLGELVGRLEEMERQKENLHRLLDAERAGRAPTGPEPVGSPVNAPSQAPAEVNELLSTLEQAREMGRQKSLQLRRQEQEMATVQRNIEALESRLTSLSGDDIVKKDWEGTSVVAHAGSTAGEDEDDDDTTSPVSKKPQRVQVPENPYLDASDYTIILDDISEFVFECREQSTYNDSEFGRRMVNFVSKLINELGHIDVTNPEQQRTILRMMRKLGK
mmetsp:Transcript_2815/g.5369  ORF Transcript_2815/g.5369 Transcript_2815/m.5369 type:complete len:399 (-) Transcript_2815:706-1902(-)